MRFHLDWLKLREEADRRARDAGLLSALGEALARRERPQIVDLGCGAGALRRVLADFAPAKARWRLVDNDPDLLDAARAAFPDDEIVALDLARDPAAAVRDADLVAATAFYDLVSEAWLDRLIAALPRRALVYAAITYDGRETWRPAHEDDAAVLSAFLAHQRGDMGFGPALGPDAAAVLAAKLEAAGWRVQRAWTPWRLETGRDDALMRELAEGIAAGAATAGTDSAAWLKAKRTSAEIGHWDLFAEPARLSDVG